MNDEPYFIFYTNYPIIDNPERHIAFLKNYSFKNAWGVDHEIQLADENLMLDTEEIEEQRHTLFTKALEQLIHRTILRKIIELGELLQIVNKSSPTVRYGLYITDHTKNEIIYSRRESLPPFSNEAKGADIYALACHSIISFLSVEGNRQKIKQCPYCKLFFIAKDTKRKICYANSCVKEDRKIRKRQQRAKNPVKYL